MLTRQASTIQESQKPTKKLQRRNSAPAKLPTPTSTPGRRSVLSTPITPPATQITTVAIPPTMGSVGRSAFELHCCFFAPKEIVVIKEGTPLRFSSTRLFSKQTPDFDIAATCDQYRALLKKSDSPWVAIQALKMVYTVANSKSSLSLKETDELKQLGSAALEALISQAKYVIPSDNSAEEPPIEFAVALCQLSSLHINSKDLSHLIRQAQKKIIDPAIKYMAHNQQMIKKKPEYSRISSNALRALAHYLSQQPASQAASVEWLTLDFCKERLLRPKVKNLAAAARTQLTDESPLSPEETNFLRELGQTRSSQAEVRRFYREGRGKPLLFVQTLLNKLAHMIRTGQPIPSLTPPITRTECNKLVKTILEITGTITDESVFISDPSAPLIDMSAVSAAMEELRELPDAPTTTKIFSVQDEVANTFSRLNRVFQELATAYSPTHPELRTICADIARAFSKIDQFKLSPSTFVADLCDALGTLASYFNGREREALKVEFETAYSAVSGQLRSNLATVLLLPMTLSPLVKEYLKKYLGTDEREKVLWTEDKIKTELKSCGQILEKFQNTLAPDPDQARRESRPSA